MGKSVSPIRTLLTGVAVFAVAGNIFAAPTPQELLHDALAARSAGRTGEAIRLLTELKALSPTDPRIDTLLASLSPAPAAKSEIPSTPPKAAASAAVPNPPQGAANSSSPSESSKPKSHPSGASKFEISNLKSEIPDSPDSLLQAAVAAQAEGKSELALAYLRQLQATSPNDLRVASVVTALAPPQGVAASAAAPQPAPASASPISNPPASKSEISNLKSEISPSGPYYGLPESLVLGVVTWVDPVNKQAVVRLHGTWKADRLYLVSRDGSFEASAILETSPFHNTRAIGVRCLEGLPVVGQDVIAPGPTVHKRIREILGPRYRGTPPPKEETTAETPPATPSAPLSGEGTLNPELKPF